eukprot:12187976-Alexandrium_andersonii.AAC.1
MVPQVATGQVPVRQPVLPAKARGAAAICSRTRTTIARCALRRRVRFGLCRIPSSSRNPWLRA